MAVWKLSPQYKKSAVERQFWYKDGKVIIREEGYRWATFSVEMDERPLTDDDLRNEDGYELGYIDDENSWEMWDMIDGCWAESEAGRDCTAEDLEAFDAAWEEGYYEGVEALGWSQDDTEYFYHGPLELTNVDTGEVFTGAPDSPAMHIELISVPHMTNTDNPVDFPKQVKDFVDGYADFVENMTDEEWEDLGKEDTLLTDWYPVSTNPVRNGTYQVLHEDLEVCWPFQSNVTSAVWDGKKWDTKKVVKWRGLTQNPEA